MKGSSIAVCFRWIVMAILTVFALIAPRKVDFALYETLSVAIVYNIIATVYVLSRSKEKRKYSILFVYTDIVMLSFLTFQLGGIDSDTYVLFFLIIGSCSILGSYSVTLCAGVFGIIAYTASCLLAAKYGQQHLSVIRLVMKDLLISLGVFGFMCLNREVRKFNELHKKEFKLARTDSLTGLANRHYFDQKVEEELRYADYTGNPLNILMFDLDNFKKFNDTYGHTLGDKLLVLFADIIKQNIRKTDIPVRYGGEEFLILIRDLDIYIAKSVAERIRRQLEKQRIYVEDMNERHKVTVSCGIAQYPRHSRKLREVIECADKALYHAKVLGKNCVVVYDDIANELDFYD